MNKIATRLRIGEKIVLGFGATGLIFLGVIWYYHVSLRSVVENYQSLYGIYGARQSASFGIETHLISMLSAEDRFLLTRNLTLTDQVRHHASALEGQADRLADMDASSQRTARQIQSLTSDFVERFDAIVEAWKIRGLDENSGLQGAFRHAVHELESRARDYNVDRHYVLLLQIRRAEKDLGLRRDPQYQQLAHQLLDEMVAATAASKLPDSVSQALNSELSNYRAALDAYAQTVLAGGDTNGGKGPFRDTAHRIETIIEGQYVHNLESRIMQLRRREKDYLLRGDPIYVEMVDQIAADIRHQITESAVAQTEKAEFNALLRGYERDFHALVDQDHLIASLTEEMYQAAARITPLVETNLAEANRLMESMSAQIAADSAHRARLSLIISAAAAVLGALFAVLITARIVRPVAAMSGLLDRLTRENPTERIPTDPDGRDEINAMAIAVNTMADHKAKFFDWWRSSMRETIALRDLDTAQTSGEHDDAARELQAAAADKLRQLRAICGELRGHADVIGATAERIDRENDSDASKTLRDAAAGIRTLASIADQD